MSSNQVKRRRLFVDLDGTLAIFQEVDTLEILYEKGYFLNLEPQHNVVEAVRILASDENIEVFIMSAVLSDSLYALEEKQKWLDRYLPEIDREHRIFPPCGTDKKEYVPGGIQPTDTLLDDYTKNLVLWHPPGKGIKLLNGINHTHGSWKKDRINFERSPGKLAEAVKEAMNDRVVYDKEPEKRETKSEGRSVMPARRTTKR